MILFFGACPPPITGQSLAMEYAFENYKGEKKIVRITDNNECVLFKILKNLLLIFIKIPLNIFLYRPKVVYISASLNTVSSLRDVAAILLAKLIKANVILHLHNSCFKNLVTRYSFLESFYKWVYGKVDVFVTPTVELEVQITSFIKNADVIEIPYFYEPILENITINQKILHPKQKIKLLFLSNLLYSKGIIDLLNVFKKISSEYSEVELHIGGEFMGDECKNYEEIKRLTAPFLKLTRVKFHGVVKGESKKKLLEACDIFILPTFYPAELFPISIIEAMRAGLAVITTNHNDLKKIYPSSVVFVEKRNLEALTNAITDLIENPYRLDDIKTANMVYAKQNYNLKDYSRKINKCIRQLDVQYKPLFVSYRKGSDKVVPNVSENISATEIVRTV